MAFQKQVEQYCAEGVPGDMAVPGQSVYQSLQYTSETPIKVGNFAFIGSDPEKLAASSGTKVLGIVQRDLSLMSYDLLSPGTLFVPEKQTVTIAVKGDFYVETKTNATVGQKVFVDKSDGSISTGNAGGSISNSIEVDWYVKTTGNAGDTIIISSWN